MNPSFPVPSKVLSRAKDRSGVFRSPFRSSRWLARRTAQSSAGIRQFLRRSGHAACHFRRVLRFSSTAHSFSRFRAGRSRRDGTVPRTAASFSLRASNRSRRVTSLSLQATSLSRRNTSLSREATGLSRQVTSMSRQVTSLSRRAGSASRWAANGSRRAGSPLRTAGRRSRTAIYERTNQPSRKKHKKRENPVPYPHPVLFLDLNEPACHGSGTGRCPKAGDGGLYDLCKSPKSSRAGIFWSGAGARHSCRPNQRRRKADKNLKLLWLRLCRAVFSRGHSHSLRIQYPETSIQYPAHRPSAIRI